MFRFLCSLIVLASVYPSSASAQEIHLQERGSAILSRSAFAHGYRHGYEQGYHHGNIDANMARLPRTRLSQFKGLPLGYDASFGSKKSFELGFAAGLQAGYDDGYLGRAFRALSQLREAGAGLTGPPTANSYFDDGVAAGFRTGFAKAISGPDAAAPDSGKVNCERSSLAPQPESAAEESYCDGYVRGFILGHADGIVLTPERRFLLEASK